MRRTVFVLITLALTLMASTSFAKQHRDDDSRKRPHVVQQYDSYNTHHAKYDRGHDKYDRHSGKHAVKVSRYDKKHRRHHVAEYRHHRQPTCNSYQTSHRDYRTTIVLPAPPLPRVVLHFPW